MKVIAVKEEHDCYPDCEAVLEEIRDKMSADYPEISDYEVEE